MIEEEKKALRETVSALLAAPAQEIPGLLDEAGWGELVAEEPGSSITILFSEHARVLSNADILDDLVLGVLGDARLGAVAYRLRGSDNVILTRRPEPGSLVVASAASGSGAVTIEASHCEDISELAGFDPTMGWLRANIFNATPAPELNWTSAQAMGRRAISAWSIGLASEMLRLASEYTSQRRQYGRPIASFQTVRHGLSECQTSIDGAEALLSVAFESGDPLAATVAKLQAGLAARRTAAHVTQVFGAIGSMKEHVLHRYVARSAVFDELLTDPRSLLDEVGARVLDTRVAPRLVEI